MEQKNYAKVLWRKVAPPQALRLLWLSSLRYADSGALDYMR